MSRHYLEFLKDLSCSIGLFILALVGIVIFSFLSIFTWCYIDNFYTINAYNKYCNPKLEITAYDAVFLHLDLDLDIKNCKLFS